ncbi:alpha/beta hydrolase [Devosia rhodophyticola]|uniref:Alpha/beta hydrolase n=1 Tax=Devosia rhodophyticola TaxID=3026423 RepID=A0ABY7Z0E9_9HYPH|nr:alpha/beta hydrolase [Devosia rhodophyticola]WDR07118.1 alpha/beta hydrolase [Devosia rhodophyticola]
MNNAPKPMTTRGQTVPVNDIEMYFEEYGDGPPLVLLHGFGGSTQNWHPFVAELSERYRLILIDLRGHGYSTNPANTFTHHEAASDVFRLLDRLGIERFSSMGISSGGMTLLHMATGQPARIKAMVLISATTHFTDQARGIMRRASIGTIPQDVQAMYRACATRGDKQVHQLISQFNGFAENHDDMNFTTQSLSTISARTLIVHGDRDNFFPVDIPVSIYRSIPDAALWIVPGGDHVPIYDSLIPFTATAMRFLDRPGG